MTTQEWLFAAGIISVITAVVHSVMGEVLIFSPLRNGDLIPDIAASPLPARRSGILWATWHLASVLAVGFSTMLFTVATQPGTVAEATLLLPVTSITYGMSAVLVFVGTKGRHPGWATLLTVSVITGFAAIG